MARDDRGALYGARGAQELVKVAVASKEEASSRI